MYLKCDEKVEIVLNLINIFEFVEFVQQLQDSSLLESLDTEWQTPHDIIKGFYKLLLWKMDLKNAKKMELEDQVHLKIRASFLILKLKNRSPLNFSEPIVGIETQKNGNPDQFFSCNGNIDD